MSRLWELIVQWWITPSPLWMQRASVRAAPAIAIFLAFAICGTAALVGPYLGGQRYAYLRDPGTSADTITHAVLRTIAGGLAGVMSLLAWWKKTSKRP